jgi:hypothetical protein
LDERSIKRRDIDDAGNASSARSFALTLGPTILACGVLAGTGWAQAGDSAADRVAVEHQRETAEALVAQREAASGRRFDSAYRQSLVNALVAQAPDRLQELLSGGDGALLPNALGDTAADLVYTPVTPCRVFDTRHSAAGILAANTQQNFVVTGTGSLAGQGGSATGCLIPSGPATAVMINFAAVTPAGAGNLRAWAVADPQPAAPQAAVMNFWAGLSALANGIAVPICNPATTSCTAGDLRLQADVSDVHVVGDVVGYFSRVQIPVGSEQISSRTLVSGPQYAFGSKSVSLTKGGTCLVTCDLDVQEAVTTGPLFFKVARHPVAGGSDEVADGWGQDMTFPATRSTGSATRAFSMPATTAYTFGCYMSANGDFIGKTANPTVSWNCR